ncbi:hypothetical protein C8Q80DRAFT_1353116 [Daedaleopsis nitida]|nr:hypothetical protein C8Q80DRAFT_1353116 [Daedaleopsis nitida]
MRSALQCAHRRPTRTRLTYVIARRRLCSEMQRCTAARLIGRPPPLSAQGLDRMPRCNGQAHQGVNRFTPFHAVEQGRMDVASWSYRPLPPLPAPSSSRWNRAYGLRTTRGERHGKPHLHIPRTLFDPPFFGYHYAVQAAPLRPLSLRRCCGRRPRRAHRGHHASLRRLHGSRGQRGVLLSIMTLDRTGLFAIPLSILAYMPM